MSTALNRDKWIPWYFVLFFAVVASVNAVMVTLAIRSYSGTVTEHPYEKGLAYNQVIAAADAQEKLGWKSEIGYEGGMLNFVLRDKAGARLTPTQAVASITRPTARGMDFTLPLKSAATPVTFPAHGVWEVRVDAEYDGHRYQHTRRIVVP